jgi:hypothetical protein
MSEGATGAAGGPSVRAGGIVLLLTWPWFLAAAVAVSSTGRRGLDEGDAASLVLGAGSLFLVLAAAPLAAASLRGRDAASRASWAGALAGTAAALALAALVGCAVASPSTPGTVVGGAVFLGLTGYAALQAAALAGAAYPAVATLWLGAPPLAFYLVLDVLGRRADWLFFLSPASAAVLTVSGPETAWARLVGQVSGEAGFRAGTVWPLLLLAVALSVPEMRDRGPERG